jgi:hypothetical protein
MPVTGGKQDIMEILMNLLKIYLTEKPGIM